MVVSRAARDVHAKFLYRNGAMNMNITSGTHFLEENTILVLGNMKDIQKCFHI